MRKSDCDRHRGSAFFYLTEKGKGGIFLQEEKLFSEGFCIYYYHQFSGISEPSGDTGDVSVYIEALGGSEAVAGDGGCAVLRGFGGLPSVYWVDAR